MIRKQLKEVLDYNEKCIKDKLWLSRNARAMLDLDNICIKCYNK